MKRSLSKGELSKKKKLGKRRVHLKKYGLKSFPEKFLSIQKGWFEIF
jgi:hypothetical protein